MIRWKKRALPALLVTPALIAPEAALARDVAALHRARLEAIVEARESLTPGQRSKLRDMRRRGHEHRTGTAGRSPIAD